MAPHSRSTPALDQHARSALAAWRLARFTLPGVAALTLVLASVPGCAADDQAGEASIDAAPADPPQPPCLGPLGPAINPASLPACCPGVGGAHCMPAGSIPDEYQDQMEACPGGGLCMPDPFIATGGVYTPHGCTSLAGQPGACLSACLPEVAAAEAILPRDVCADDERCAPCVHPVTGENTGACDLGFTCAGSGS